MIGKRSLWSVLLFVGILFAPLAPRPAAGGDLANAQLLIAGSRLKVSPESQTVPYDTPTIVETHLEGYDASRGVLPKDLRVLADFTGPEIDGILVLETVPNQPFRIPRLRLQGEYRLDNIRLVEREDLVAYAEPRSAAVLVTQVLITRVTSRALTLDEIRSYGIVVDDDSFQAFNFTFAFGVAGETIDYNIPILYYGPTKEQVIGLWDLPGWHAASTRFTPPRMAPFQLKLDSQEGSRDDSNGGCEALEGDCRKDDVIPIPGVILFPTDISLLHQFFSVVLMAQNGAPANDPLTIHDLTAKVALPPGLRQARTEPPTPLGVPVPVRVPGPDGELGTGDDLTFLVAQATGQAEVLVEGLKEGTHIVSFDLEGVLRGLPGGQVRRVTGKAQGAVIVRDPTLNVTITHPDVVREGEDYTMLLTVTNTGTAPANLMTIRLPLEKLAGVEVVGPNEKTVTVLPGDAEVVDFRLHPKRTGRVTATAARAPSSITPVFELTVGVGENGIPLSPNAIILPRAADSLPPGLIRDSLNLLGLGFSLATAPPSLLRSDLPRVSRSTVDLRVYQIAQAGRHTQFGEELFDSAAQLAAEWTGARDAEWEWDLLRRTTQKGARVGASLGSVFAAEAAATSPRAAFDRFVKTTGYLPVMQGALAVGQGVTLEVSSRTGGQRVSGSGLAADRVRELPFADLYSLGGAQMALLAVPEEGGYRATVRAGESVSAALHLLAPGANGALRMVRWTGVSLSAGGVATAEFSAAASSFVLMVDSQGDGVVDDQIPGDVETLTRRPFQALAAVQNTETDPTGHVVEVLFTTDVDPASLIPRDATRFTIPGKVSNGGLVQGEQDTLNGAGHTVENPFEGLRNTRIVRVVFNNPLSPYTPQNLTVKGVKNPLGEQVTATTVEVAIPGNAMPGTMVEGTVFGPDGKPMPFAEIELRESDMCLFCEESCRTHKTAVVRADAAGNFLFDYVRQTACSDIYQLKAVDASSGYSGTATGRVRFVGQTVRLDVLMLGRGTVRGRVLYDDGTVPPDARVIAESPVFREARAASVDANGNYEVKDVTVGTITLSASDGQGRFVVKTVEVPAAGAVVEHNLVLLRNPEQPPANGEVRGRIFRPDGTTPVAGAYVALYVDGKLVGTRRSEADGAYDFGQVPAGRGEIETFEGATGQSGVQVFFELLADRVNTVDLVMRDERGTVTGYVYRKVNGTNVPLFGVIVWAEGTPFKTATDAQGRYTLEGVFAGTRNISAADLEKKVKLTQSVTIGADGQIVESNFYFQDGSSTVSGIGGEVLGFDGSPVFGATVHIAAGDQHWYRTATSDASGRFTLPDLGVGVYEVHAFKGTAGGKALATIRFAGDTPFISIRFKKGSIRGSVKAESAPGQLNGVVAVVTYRTTTVRLELVGLDMESHNITTNPDGSFEIPDVLTGPYTLTVTNSFYGTRTVRGELVSHGDAPTHDFVFEADRSGNISGTVLDQDAVTPVQGAKVVLRHPGFNNYELTTDAEGRFKFELVPPVTNAFPIQVSYENGVVFRKAEAWVRYNQKGQDLDVEIVLPKQGSISGRVADANGVVVPGSVVTLQESAYPRRRLVINADAEGNFEFNNVFAGTVTLSARAPSLGGLGGKTTVEIKAEGEEVAGVTIFLEATGKIAGQVKLPPAPPEVVGAPVASAEVRLWRGGYLFDVINADTEGRFEFSLLPLGWYEVVAFDPRTGRFGRRRNLQVAENNQVVEGDVQLEARGIVDGHLYEPGTTLGVPGATIQLSAHSIKGFTTYSSTGADGYFEFLGIPQGELTLTTREPGGRRRAAGKGEIVSEGQRVTVDLFLDRQGTVIGSVLNPIGDPDGVFPNANTLIYQSGQIVGATLESEYEFPGIILGETFRINAEEVGGPHRGQVTGKLTEEGPVRVDVRMQPIGSVKVDVSDSFGNPVNAAKVELLAEGFYGYKRLFGDTGSDNSVTFQDVGAGRIAAYVENVANGLKGSASANLVQDGEILQINVTLQNSGVVTGVVVLPDGVTPAADAPVALQIGSRTLLATTDATGRFTLPSVPMGSFLLVLQERFGPGTREVRSSLTTNGQVLDLGTVVLDDANPKVVEITPEAGSVDLPLNTVVIVRFSEPMRTTGALVGNLVTLQTAAGAHIGYNSAWIDGNTAIRLTPSPPLQNFTTYRVRVLGESLYDAAGRRMEQGLQFSFTTVDILPPTVIEVSPANNAKQVPLSAQVRLTFNESVNELSLSGGHVQLTDVTTGANLATTFILDNPGRVATVTPVDALMDGHEYRITVNGVADKVGNAMTVPVVSRFFTTDTTPPVISNFLPAEGASYTSGDRILVSATVTDPAGVGSVALRIGGWLVADNTAPYSWNVPAPVMASAGDVTMELEVADTWGNAVESHRTIQVQPRSNAQAPQADLGCLTHQVVPGVQIEIPFHLTDDEGIESYRLTVDGATIHEVLLADAADVSTFTTWTVPASASPGSTLALRIEARDFAGNVTGDDWSFEVVAGVHLTGDQTLNGNYAGQTLFLAKGTFTAPGPLNVESLILPRGVTLKAAAGVPLEIFAEDLVEVACGGQIDVNSLGYAGGNAGHIAGYAPEGVTGSATKAGGSHGGRGAWTGAGEVYDSVYAPRLAGGGGGYHHSLNLPGAGGGVVRIEAGEVELGGTILAKGKQACSGAGAGGTVSITAGVVGGGGTIDVSGGNRSCTGDLTGGGGGRVAIVTGTWNGFDPATQVTAWGGVSYDSPKTYAAPGTVFYRKTGDAYGALLIDAGETGGVDNKSLATELPALGSGTVTGTEAAGGDLWVSAGSGFAAKWLGTWVRLRGASGADLGVFRAAEIDGAGRLRLAGASAVTGAAGYQGEYRFDRVEVRNGAGLDTQDPLLATDSVYGGEAELTGHVTGATATVKSDAVVRPARGGELRMTLSGKLTVEADASLNVTGTGYAGGDAGHPQGYVPAGVTGSTARAGGSHGGQGALAGAGEVYDSVYVPRQGGGGGGYKDHLSLPGAGGGVVRLEVGELALDGSIEARGISACGGGSGAGGTVAVVAGVVSGGGMIDASGADRRCTGLENNSGGGGRISIITGTWNGFNPAAQAKTWGGASYDSPKVYAAPGTIFHKQAGDAYGSLLIDAGEVDGVDRVSPTTDLPSLGAGTVTATEVAGGDLWISAGAGFAAKWLGVWVRLSGSGGAALGSFPVAEIDGAGRLRLAGASGAAGAVAYEGEYRFDRVEVKNGAGMRSNAPIVGPEVVLEGNAQVSGTISAASVRVKSGATVKPASGSELRITTPGKLTIEAGATLDVTGLGYAGGDAGHIAGYAPEGVTGSATKAGGSHGGRGAWTGAGEVYDSVYAPRLAGGGGGYHHSLNLPGAGGGVVWIEAGEVELAGTILAKGKQACSGAGAGGTVSIATGVMSGGGTIDASGGNRSCTGDLTGGGGGRVAIVTGTWNGFDPATQVTAWGGATYDSPKTYAAPGTVFYRQAADTYGTLLIDAGEINGADNESPVTELPSLGAGTVTATEVAGGDLWISAGPGFTEKWLGVWVRLRDASGAADLGAFRAAEIDGAGRLRLAGASAVTGAAGYQGEYRFDRIEVRNGAGLDAQDPLLATDSLFDGEAELTGHLTGATATVKSDAVLRPARGGELRMSLSGKLTVEADGVLNVTGTGYAGGDAGHPDGYAPSGVTGSKNRAGGSHGGRGMLTDAGEVFDSVYAPRQGGGGGAYKTSDDDSGGPGGGVVRLEVGELALAGSIEARGTSICGSGSGAGGTVSIVAGVVSGAGLIDASGADRKCTGENNAGGGGRISIVTGTWNGFSPAAQAKAWGGASYDAPKTHAAPGTVFYKKGGDTYGTLLIDAGETNGVDRVSLTTQLPALGSGTVTAAQAAGGDLWVSAGSGFAAKWLGVWVRLRGVGGADLGAFPVAEIDAAGRLRLSGAAAAAAATSYEGEYRFDQLDLKNGAGMQATDRIVGPELVLEGNAQVSGTISAANVRVKAGATVTPASGSELRITTPGKLTIEANAKLDVTGKGYAGGTSSHPDGYVPAGVTGSINTAGGSHGGRGGLAGAGEVYDSVYAPQLAGGGGAFKPSSAVGGAGGGVIRIETGELELAGSILARGESVCGAGSGAGGTVSITASVVSGAGLIDASGADRKCTNSVTEANPGGGGRVSIVTGTWNGFNPVTQVKAWGGSSYDSPKIYAAPGTVYYKRNGDLYGTLMVDAGEVNATTDRVSPAAELPVLGTGAVTAAEAMDDDLWVSAASGFATKWLGVWVRLRGEDGEDLGSFRVAEIDVAGRLRLVGASEVTGAANYQGEYRFDRVELKNGAGLDARDPLLATDSQFEGEAELTGELTGATATVKTDAILRPARGGDLRISLTGKLTVETGAKLEVTGKGYAGGTAAHPDGYVPGGVTGSTNTAGGSHGGRGGLAGAGEIYDSVYAPQLAGGGGGFKSSSSVGGAGGGVVQINVGELALAGTIEAKGESVCGAGSGAGGTVSITASVVSGAGLVDASGADRKCTNSVTEANPGGGGRVSIVTGTWNGFNPVTQVKALGGSSYDPPKIYAAPGTVYYKRNGDLYGTLMVDAGEVNGADRVSPAAELPTLAVGAVTATEAAGGDLWVSAGTGFAAKWLGVWVRLRSAGGTDLGTFPVAAIDGAGRIRLTGASAAAGAASYQGEYRFDRVELKNGAGLDARDPLLSADSLFEGESELTGELTGATATVKAGAILRPARGGDLRLSLTGKLTVETGAKLEVTGKGYAGGTSSHPDGYVPGGVTGSTNTAGGSHGGRGGLAGAGEIYDSVYAPQLAGGGGGFKSSSSVGGAGGGVVRINVGELALAGTIEAKGESVCGAGSGAGGTIAITAGVVSGAGLIDASGADRKCTNSVTEANPGGGGRVSIVTGTWNGFNPVTQVKAWGGSSYDSPKIYAAPGTVYYKQNGDLYGTLMVDAGEVNATTDRVSPATDLPVLGTGAVTATEAAGGDLWVSASTAFAAKWLGVWVRLRGAGGQDLGAFLVAEIDGAGRLRLTGASAAAGAASYQGEYRFDRVQLKNGAGLDAQDPLLATDSTFEGEAELAGVLTGATSTVKAGAVLRPARGSELRIALSGKLTVEATGSLNVTGKGYAGGTAAHPEGYAPAGVTGSVNAAGGSHGGKGGLAGAGEVYGSVYTPQYAGGGGGEKSGDSDPGGPGGGVVRIEAGELALNGTIEARGEALCGPGAGAGGTVSIVAGVVSGAGFIDVSGAQVSCSSSSVNGGGGGRVAIVTGAWNGFNAATQVKAYGGPDNSGNNPAAAGTVYTRISGQTYGDLRVDQGRATAPASVGVTIPTSIGRGTVGTVAGEAANPTALWIEPQDPAAKFGLGVAGMWVRINGVDYPVLAERSDRRGLLLGGAAGAVTAGQAFYGVYKLDSVTVAGRASLEFRDLLDAPAPSVATGSALVLFDIDPPVVNITQPAAGTLYNSGQTVQVAAQVTDNRTVTSVTFRLGEQSFVDTAAPYEWSVAAPSVEAEGELPITVEAVDVMNNRTTATRPIVVRPLAAGAAPAVAFTCPTSGILLPPGMALSMTVAASHENGIEKVELLEGTTVLATDFQAPYAFSYTVPANALDGQVVSLKARARSFSGNVAEVPLDIRVLQGTVVSANRTVGATDTSLENASVIVTGGTLTVTGPHTFRDLVVLNGAKVTHPDTTDTTVYKLELTLQRDLYVGCGATIDVTARGYRGGNGSTRAYGYGNSPAEGANPGVGGSHGGRGGNYDGSSPVYGSFHDPRDPGAGGGYHSGNGGGRSGGGVVRVTASGVAIVDGSILANGESYHYGNGGAGGSIRLNAQTLKGLGTISASGGIAGGSQAGGGGGRIALYAAAVSPDLLSRTIAKGGQIGSSQAWGAAGTIFVKPDAQALGDLILDNGGVASPHYTELMTVGRGVVDAAADDGFTDNEADFRHFLGAAEVAFNGDLGTLYPILNHTHHGTSLTLAVPTPPLSAVVEPGDTYEGVYRFNSVTVRNGAKGIALDTVITGSTTGTDWTPGYTPTVQISSPVAGTTYGAGTNFNVAVSVQSVLGVKSVTFQFNGQTFVDTASPYTATFTAPAVNEGTDLVITAMATDLSGNRFGTTRTVHVDPAVDPNPPVVALGSCPRDGDTVVAGAALILPFTATDDQSIQDYSLVVDGVTQQTVTANQASVSSSFNWTPPAGAAPGTAFVVRVQARDFAGGVGFAAMTLTVTSVAPLTGSQSLTSARNGQALYLGAGTYTVQEPLSLASLTLLNGARVVGLAGQTLDLTVAGAVRIQCGAQLDLSHLGYPGGQVANSPGGKPAGVTASLVDAGGSHGGTGSLGELAGPAGEVYGSVYEPLLGGGGGSVKHSNRTGGSGGGTLRLTASGVVLDGEILARGQKRQADGYTDSSGAGGSVLITAGTLSGAGRIDASGGDYQYYYWGGGGGGGRVALRVDTLSGFDPALQVKAWGGALLNTGTSPPLRYAGPGTVFVKTQGQTYGRLIIDAGKESNGSERIGPQTPLPALGTGAVTGFVVQGTDALVTAGSAFKPQWVGAWMALEDSTGTSLGSFRVLSVDAQGKALLKDAEAATAAAVYRGQYRFDRIDLKGGAGLSSADALIVSGDVVAEPKTRLPADLTAANVTLKPGAPVTVSLGGNLKMTLSGRLTVETGAALDVTGLGYAGGSTANAPGTAPAGVTASLVDAGGSHGGIGSLGELTGPAGEVYGSVYEPRLGGGGGSVKHSSRVAGSGGGTIQLTVSELVLNGAILARGQKQQTTNGYTDSSGAGGSILITADTLSGAGLIDASGGDYNYYYWGGSGGGGRVGLYANTLSGFDPATQIRARGGVLLNGATPAVRYASPGTVYVKLPADTHGKLYVDQGGIIAGKAIPSSPLPGIGVGTIGTATADTVTPTALWIEPADTAAKFALGAVGMWVRVDGTDYRVIAQTADRRKLLLAGAAGTVTTGAAYRGVYKFDEVFVRGGAKLEFRDTNVVGTFTVDATSSVIQNVP